MEDTKNNKSVTSKIVNIVLILVLLIVLVITYNIYQSNNLNGLNKSEQKANLTEFSKDENVKYSNTKSYKIESEQFNDAMLSKKVKIRENTPYKLSCMVRTKDVEAEKGSKGAGAQLSLANTTQRSIAITGNNEWQKIELIFDSENRNEVEIGARLGGTAGNCKGTAWFSDFKLEEGIQDTSNEWKFACFIFKTTDVTLDGKETKLSMTKDDISDINSTLKRFASSCETLSEGKMTASYDVYNINTPISSLSYDNEFGYYVAPEDIENQIKGTITGSDYDHIFIVLRLGNDEHSDDIQVNDWIGLGSMDYYGIGYSNIRLPNDSKSYMYKYNSRINTFPEEVFLHEFLHSLERDSTEYGYNIPALHDYQKYGYENEKLIGQMKWYQDYMNKQIQTTNGLIGLPEQVYTLKPAKSTNFSNPNEKDFVKQPQNFPEEIKELIANLKQKIN